jgi:hypothetical protein
MDRGSASGKEPYFFAGNALDPFTRGSREIPRKIGPDDGSILRRSA